MESDLQPNLRHQQQLNSGLLRYRSAPSSYFANFLESEDCEEFLNHRATSPETEQLISRFFTTASAAAHDGDGDGVPFIAAMKVEEESNFSTDVQVMYQDNESDLLPTRNESGDSGSGHVMDRVSENNSNLIRHSSSPAGLFSNINTENGYVTMRGMSKFVTGSGNTTGEASFPSPTSRMKNQMNFASGAPSSSGLIRPCSPKNENFEENCSSSSFITPFLSGSWDDSALMTENFQGLKRARYDSVSGLNGLENQNIGTRNSPLLSHHLSLPKTSAEMAAVDNLLQFEDSVPCRSRAKRGCATHPRSIAERVRRTRISERMRKLQELVPNMDKQTNTADMLDLAVDYIKDLQKDVKTLEDNRAKCTCSSKQRL